MHLRPANPRLTMALGSLTITLTLTAIALPLMQSSASAKEGKLNMMDVANSPLQVTPASNVPENVPEPGHPVFVTHVQAAAAPSEWHVRAGDTLASISAALCRTMRDWPAIWWPNRQEVRNPDTLTSGETLTLRGCSASAAEVQAALNAATPPSPPPSVSSSGTATGTFSGSSGSLQACIIAAESGGNPDIWNPTGHWGLYQFSAGTWYSYGAAPGTFGNASASYQNQIYMNVVAHGPQAVFDAWESDGCPQRFGMF